MKHENAVIIPSSSPLPTLFPPHLLRSEFMSCPHGRFSTEHSVNESTENGTVEVSTTQPESSAETTGSLSKQLDPDPPKRDTKTFLEDYLFVQTPYRQDTMENPGSSKIWLLNQHLFGKSQYGALTNSSGDSSMPLFTRIQLDGFNLSAEGLESEKKRKELKSWPEHINKLARLKHKPKLWLKPKPKLKQYPLPRPLPSLPALQRRHQQRALLGR
ncbi:hypothetical protein DL96DRAFT_1712484 [Flagelloscypha sp. PMI_526]|nr:hypothetical protein DL96DRAFT_1712484 [Flagelloscypha sp. PMI_526]